MKEATCREMAKSCMTRTEMSTNKVIAWLETKVEWEMVIFLIVMSEWCFAFVNYADKDEMYSSCERMAIFCKT